MDKAIEQLFKTFNHLAREVQVYVFSGFVIAINALIIDHFYYNSTLLTFIQTKKLTIPIVVVLYLIGQFCMAFYYLLLEWKGVDKKINSFLGFNYSVELKYLPKIYNNSTELYLHFVERYAILMMMRWLISAACFINLIIDIIILIKKEFHWQLLFATIIFATGFFIFYLLTAKTEKDYVDRINLLKVEE